MEPRLIRVTAKTFGYLLLMSLMGAAQVPGPSSAGNGGAIFRVAGVVLSKTDSRPLPGARVVLRDARNSSRFESVVTTEDGKFAFVNVPAGKYGLEGTKRGFVVGFYDQHEQFSTAIVAGAGFDTEHFELRLAPQAVISGRVLDEAGEPVRHAAVSLYAENRLEGIERIEEIGSAQTDDLGAYEFPSLTPRTYFLSVRATPWYAVHPPSSGEASGTPGQPASAMATDHSLDVAYPITYYSDATDADSATPIPVGGGERVQADLHLDPVPALRVRFRVPGDSTHGFAFPQFEQSSFDGTSWIQHGGGNLISPGLVEITGIPAGRYNVRFQGPGGPEGLQMNEVDLSKDGEQIDSTDAEPLGTIKISVQIAGEPIPAGLSVGLRSKVRTVSAWKGLDEKGQAELDHVQAGRYSLVIWGTRKPYFISRISAEGAEVVGHTVIVSAGSSPSIVVTAVAGSVEVQGIAKRGEKPMAGAMVVLVPANPEGNRDLFRRDQSDQDGTFTLRNVVPGSYTVVAIEGGWDLNWSEPGVIAVYAKHGQTIDVGSDKPVNLPRPIEVQAK